MSLSNLVVNSYLKELLKLMLNWILATLLLISESLLPLILSFYVYDFIICFELWPTNVDF